MLKINNAGAWEVLYEKHYKSGGTFLPAWGMYSSGSKLTSNLLRLKDKNVLELACGAGESIPYVLKNRPRHYTGIDISEHALEEARKKYHSKNVSFSHADISKKLPFDSNSFDEIFSVYGMGWSSNIKMTLSEIYRMLKPGGTFTFSWDHYLARIVDEHNGKIVLQKSYNIEQPTGHHNWNNTGYNIRSMQAKPSAWFQLLRDAGFEVTAFHEIEISDHRAMKNVFSDTYRANRAKMIPFGIVMQGKKSL